MIMGIGGLAAAGAMAAPGVGPSLLKAVGDKRKQPGSKNVSLPHADALEWARHVGSTFLVRSEMGPLHLTLEAVKTLPSGGARPESLKRKTAFAAHFVSKNGALPAGDLVYRVMHPAKGEFDIYFSPAAKGMLAIFN